MRSLVLAGVLATGCGEVVKPDTTTTCGDGVVTADEECDTGGESAGCNDDCTRAVCGDGKVNAMAGEDCDDGDTDDTNECNNACKVFETVPPPSPMLTSTGTDGAFAPVGNITLMAGVRNYTTINIPAGVTVTVSGHGTLDLRATGDVVIEGTIDLSGGKGGDGNTYLMGGCYTGGGGGGSTGTRLAGANGLNVTCAAGGTGGTGQNGTAGTEFGAACPSPAGQMGGGAGAGVCAGGGGGGGYAGGGGGAGFSSGVGGRGGAAFGLAAAKGGVPAVGGVASTAGEGGSGTDAYAGKEGTFASLAECGTLPGTSGGGGAIGPEAAADLAVRETFYPGSGGGGGGGQCINCATEMASRGAGSGGGGGGGGALRIVSPTSITIGAGAQLLANGGAGGSAVTTATGAAGGGGGSGGVIYLATPSLSVGPGAVISAVGGVGGNAVPETCGKGGDGGLGRIRLSVGSTCALDGTFNPPLASGCSPSTAPEKTYIATYPN